MIVAQEKRKTNIAEYIIYLWQIEDMIRALKLDIDRVEEVLVNQYRVEENQKVEIGQWYQNLVLMMQKEQKQQSGHLQFLVNLTDELNRFHLTLIEKNIDQEYSRLYSDIQPDLELIRQKSGLDHHDIELSLNTLYLILMLKVKNQEISEGTQNAVWKFGNFLGYLSKLFKAWEAGDLEIEDFE
jgi:L-rhamnose mutarotase